MNDDELRLRAYYVWEAAGRPDGDPDRHWAQARRDAGLIDEAWPTIVADRLTDVLSPENRVLLEQRILPDYLARRRWFAAKNRTIRSLKLVEPVAIDELGVLAQIEVALDGSLERYALPLALSWDGDAYAERDPTRDMGIVAVLGDGRRGVLTDAFFMPAFIRSLLGRTQDGAVIGSEENGMLDFRPEPAGRDQIGGAQEIRWLSTEQSNTSVIVDGRIVMKLIRRLQPGVNPEAEMCRFLTRAGYENASPLLAEVIHTDRDGESRSVLVLEGFVPNQGDAWTFATECLRGALAAQSETDDSTGKLQGMVELVGRRLGELHAALSKAHDDSAFDPEVAQPGDFDAWRDAAIEQFERAVDVLASCDDPLVSRIVDARSEIVDAVRRAELPESDALKTRIHGDFHLGQVLWSGTDACIIDFEGEPARPIESRRAKSSALKDVAGLLRSIDYAGAFAVKEVNGTDGAAILHTSISAAGKGFLRAYQDSSGTEVTASLTGDEPDLLNLFLLEKAAYEVCYEAANRPDWLLIPVRGMARALAAFTDAINPP
ncbi:trehalose synthase [Caballeronia temeraria]|uniref:Maltokinase n=1 Tax=Caballeronia temeraria TaxID=1777137 RepID=A0A158AES1_9BURK|nr:putative maltokinase [Caballeronia temeraria]SAK56372.1 trehalose synthase [Caballeronia temeraria]